jgi:O-antigen ligase
VELLISGINMFLHNPMTGVGFGKYWELSCEFNPGLWDVGGIGEGHNLYVQVLAETGLAGFVPLALVFFFAFSTLRSIPETGRFAVYRHALTGALFGFMFVALFVSALPTKFFWLCVFLTSSLRGIAVVEEKPHGDAEREVEESAFTVATARQDQ